MSDHQTIARLALQSCCEIGACNEGRDDSKVAVSVIIPTYNRATIVLDAIRSVFRQTFQDLEVIVVDDGSDDDTYQQILALRDPRVTVIRHDMNKGAAAARNTGVAAAKGKYVAFLDSDDQWAHDKLARQVSFLEAGTPQFRASCTGFHYMVRDFEQTELRIPQHPLSHADFLLGCRCSPGSTLMVETAFFKKVGPFNEEMRRLEDWDWLMRCTQISPVGVLQKPLARIDTRVSGASQYMNVKRGARIMMSSWCSSGGQQQSYRNRRLLLGTLWNEIAASAYISGRYGAAVFSFVASMLFLPERRLQFYRRVLARIGHDIVRAGSADNALPTSNTGLIGDKLADRQT